MRALSLIAFVVGVCLMPTALGLAKLDHDRHVAEIERILVAETNEHGGALENYFQRARSIVLLTGNAPAFSRVLAEPGTREAKVARQGRSLRDATRHLRYLGELYRGSIGETCFIDAAGEELARVVGGRPAAAGDLSTDEEHTPFFAPAFALRFGETFQTRPYVSRDTREWVLATATLVPQPDGRKRAIVHFEVTVESFRRAMGATAGSELRVVDARTGGVVIDGTRPQLPGTPLGVPRDRRFVAMARTAGETGVAEVDGHRVAYRRVHGSRGNANDWLLVARAEAPTGSLVDALRRPAPLTMLAVALVVIVLAGISLRAARRELEGQATTDALTGLGNRRKLLDDLERRARGARAEEPVVLALFDLNGFKDYNDTFGHPAGDALLQRLGRALAGAVAPYGGRAYRPGGDEFCVIAGGWDREAIEAAGGAALSETGEGFEVTTASGSVVLPHDTGDAMDALRLADAAMYAQKRSDRATAGRQSSDVLLRALEERHPDLGDHLDGVTELAVEVGRRLGIAGEDLVQLEHAAALHDIGKVAIPDAIVHKPGPLSEDEWAFMRRHTVIGERIIWAAPSLRPAARLVRASHEAFDGTGYPDGTAGADIPLGARIIAVCDAFDAMLSHRPYSPPRSTDEALAELRRCAGTQFDPAIVEAFGHVVAERARSPLAGRGERRL